ncbi:hypothetical protein HYDPIDRAFT_111556 [Hydnomerulius pinastri MD-312]|uniref:Uncharacterized protein n=1 Tax=Hydnomerulius pinastri MD-312 TaxID=994086 RepID=A0A0C9WG66_9AGAM|nr:hypothetical protein HYDPIDRAFT_111556 [Hydnomerulius pinastri MD-312]
MHAWTGTLALCDLVLPRTADQPNLTAHFLVLALTLKLALTMMSFVLACFQALAPVRIAYDHVWVRYHTDSKSIRTNMIFATERVPSGFPSR